MTCRHILSWTVWVFAAAALPAAAVLPSEELARNRRALEQLKAHPDHLRRVRADAEAFFALPEEKRAQIVQLDRDLSAMPANQQAHLHAVMERYAAWLDKLDPRERECIAAAKGSRERLAIVRDIRDQEWMKYQPRALRTQYTALDNSAKARFVAKLRQAEQDRLLEWRLARRFWRELEKGIPLPAKLTDFPPDVVYFVKEYLRPRLSQEELQRLDGAQGIWPQFPVTMVELADKHPPALPGANGPTSLAELPSDVKARLKNKKGNYLPPLRKLLEAEKNKHWPEFAIALTTFASRTKYITLPHELWAWGHSCLSPGMKDFVDNKLVKELDSDEKLRLLAVEGKWPDYPVAIDEMARRHHMNVPWQTLPGTRERWTKYRDLHISERAGQ